jgi:hypothetical protein
MEGRDKGLNECVNTYVASDAIGAIGYPTSGRSSPELDLKAV